MNQRKIALDTRAIKDRYLKLQRENPKRKKSLNSLIAAILSSEKENSIIEIKYSDN